MQLPSEYSLAAPVQKGQKGAKVKLVQEWLCLNGISVAIDKDFGPATEKAVMQFQKSKKIPANGIIDQDTMNLLSQPMINALKPILPGNQTFNQLIVAYAANHLKENPREIGGANCGPWVRLYMNGNEGEPWYWCAGFSIFIYKQAAETLNAKLPIQPTFSCDNIANQAIAKGYFKKEKEATPLTIKPGSLFLKRNAPGDWVHTGIVTLAHNDSFETIEGNTNDDGSRDGYEVCKRVRGYKGMDFMVV